MEQNTDANKEGTDAHKTILLFENDLKMVWKQIDNIEEIRVY